MFLNPWYSGQGPGSGGGAGTQQQQQPQGPQHHQVGVTSSAPNTPAKTHGLHASPAPFLKVRDNGFTHDYRTTPTHTPHNTPIHKGHVVNRNLNNHHHAPLSDEGSPLGSLEGEEDEEGWYGSGGSPLGGVALSEEQHAHLHAMQEGLRPGWTVHMTPEGRFYYCK